MLPAATTPSRSVRLATVSLTCALALTGTVGASATPPAATGPGVLAAWDFDDGLQGWTIDAAEGGSTWAVVGDRDDWDTGPSVHHPGNPDATTLPISRGDHHLAVEAYLPDTTTTAMSPVVRGDGRALTFRADLRHWTEAEYDTLVVEWGAQDVWNPLVVRHGRGMYPLWEAFEATLQPDTDFRIRLTFTSDVAVSGDRSPVDHLESVAEAAVSGLGVWIDDVVLTVEGGRARIADELPPQGRRTTERHDEDSSAAFAGGGTAGPVGPDTGQPLPAATADKLANPDYLERLASAVRPREDHWSDPYSWDWDGQHGQTRRAWIVNRYGVPLTASLFAPLAPGPHPAVVFVGGHWMGDAAHYRSLLMRVAEAGYVVASVAPQAQGYEYTTWLSAWMPSADLCGPLEETRTQWWRQPQEGGLRELGECAGLPGPAPECDAGSGPVCATAEPDPARSAQVLDEVYQHHFGAQWAFAGIDAAHWLVSDHNPWRDLVDEESIGLFGHSAGGFAAIVGPNADPLIKAGVALDQFGGMPPGLVPTAPTLLIALDNAAQRRNAVDPLDGWYGNPHGVATAVRDHSVASGFVAVREAMHNDVTYQHLEYLGPPSSSRWAQSVSLHYLLAWFDLHLRGDTSARDRLLASTVDDHVDRSARGVGQWNPVDGNVPYTIGGDAVADHLSTSMTSWIHLDGVTHDLRS